jgi:general secretion pathway protein D
MPIRLLIGLVLVTFCTVLMAQKDDFTLNLNEVDIKALIDTVADITGKNFIVDPRVTGKVTVVTSKPMRASQIYELFLSILKVHGFSAVASGNIVKIVPNINAKQEFAEKELGDDGLLTRIIQLHHVDAAEMVQILLPLMPQHAFMSAFTGSNAIILSDTAGNVNRLAEMIIRMDKSGVNKVDLITLRHAKATGVAETLTKIISGRYAGKTGGFIPTVVPEERTNTVLLAGDSTSRREIRSIIADLDTPSEADDGNTQVIYLHYAQAKELVETLTGINDSKGKATDLAKTLESTQKDVDIRADEATNALVITAPDVEMRSLQDVVRQLDIRRAQVHIEAIIAEVSYTKDQEIGVEWSTKTVKDGVSVKSMTNNLGDFVSNAGKSLSVGYFVGSELRALLNAFAQDTNVNVLSTPSIVTLDNEEASILVGQNIPTVSGSFTTNTSGSTNPFQTVQRQDIGVKLEVTPQINEGNAIKLKVKQEVSSVISNDPSTGPTLSKREIETSVMVDDGKILVLGGLIQDDVQETVEKVPIIGDIPYLGHLFQDRKSNLIKRNLMVFLRPVIMRDPDRASSFTEGKYNDLRYREQRSGKNGVFLMPNEHTPILPALPPVRSRDHKDLPSYPRR